MKNLNSYILEKFRISKNTKVEYKSELKKGDKILRVIFWFDSSIYSSRLEVCPVVEFSRFSEDKTILYYIKNGEESKWVGQSNITYELNSNGIYEYADQNTRDNVVLFFDKEYGVHFIDDSIKNIENGFSKKELEEYLDREDIKVINNKLDIANSIEELERYKKTLL